MKKNDYFFIGRKMFPRLRKTFKIMKLTVFLLLLSIMQVFANESYSQNTKLTFDMEDVTVKEVLGEIESMSEFYFLYSSKIIDDSRKTDIAVKNEKITKILDKLFLDNDVDFVVRGRQIVLTSNELADSFRGFSTQEKAVSGKITDENGDPIPGVNIMVKGTSIGTITDMEGNYSLSVPADAVTLLFSFIGMETQEIAIGNSSTINVTLQSTNIGLDEVVAIGYGTVKKSDLTGAISTVKVSDLANIPASDPIKALQGRISGLSITSNSGQPGDGSSVVIRGIQSINGSNSPIYVVDGIIMGSIDGLNHLDFKSVSVLKDASAAAIYGARAANGVILITTKRGTREGKITLTYDGFIGVQGQSNLRPDMLKGLDWMNLYRESFVTGGVFESQFPDEQFIENNYGYRWNAGNDSYEKLPNAVDEDWFDAMRRQGVVQRHNLSLSGGSESSNYYFSTAYYSNKGMITGTGNKKYNITFSSDHKVGKLFDFGNSLMISSNRTDGYFKYYAIAMAKPPITRVYEDDGDWGVIDNITMEHMHQNPLWMSEKNKPHYKTGTSIKGNVYLITHILEGLDLTARGNVIKSFGNNVEFYAGADPKFNWEHGSTNSINKRRSESTYWSTDLLLNYEKSFNDNHKIKLLAGYSNEENTSESLSGYRQGTPNNKIPYLGAGDPGSQTNDDSFSDWAFQSFFGRLNYNFQDKYLITATVRSDGTSRLADGHRWGTFPMGSVAWRISKESFMQDISFINDLKLRASYGSLGNIGSISTYGTIADMTPVKLVLNQAAYAGYTMMKAVNKDLQWEATDKLNIGLDGTFFDNQIYFEANFFQEKTHDLLFPLALPYSAGFGSWFPTINGKPFINAGEVKNTGFELDLGWRKHVGDWNFDIRGNASHIKNEVVDLFGQDLRTQGLVEGSPVKSFFGYTSDGLILSEDQKAGQWTGKEIGDIHIVDMPTLDADGNIVDPDGTITPADRDIIGNKYPKLIYGLMGNISYKAFTLQVQLSGVYGIDKYLQSGGHAPYNYFYSWARGDVAQLLDRYHPTRNPDGELPRLDKKNRGKNNTFSTFWLEDASYLRVQNISLNYKVPQKITTKMNMSALSVYVSSENLYTFTKFSLSEVDTRKDALSGIPQPRTFTIGLRASF